MLLLKTCAALNGAAQLLLPKTERKLIYASAGVVLQTEFGVVPEGFHVSLKHPALHISIGSFLRRFPCTPKTPSSLHQHQELFQKVSMCP